MIPLVDSIKTKEGEILEHFLRHPTKPIHIRALAREVGVSGTWVAKTVRKLEKHGLITLKKRGVELEAQALRDNTGFRAIKRAYNLYSISTCGLVDSLVNTFGNPPCVVLFGSYARGEDTEDSDIDIAVLTTRKTSVSMDKHQKILQRTLKITLVDPRRIETEFLNTLANGIVLYGYLQVAP